MTRTIDGFFYDHLDVRVRDVARARAFYDPFCVALGLTKITESEQWTSYDSEDPKIPFIGITGDPAFQPSRTRIAFRAASNEEVDRIAAIARISGATQYEPPHVCPEYSPGYYASFFEDPDGNRYEICHRAEG